MKEVLYTIPVNEGFEEDDECPFCFMERVQEDLEWFIAKFDYRNAGEPWKNSQDALLRTMQKLQGLHPSDPPFKNK